MDMEKKIELFTAYTKLASLHSTSEERREHLSTPPQYWTGLSKEARKHQLEIDGVSEAEHRKKGIGKIIIILILVVSALLLFFFAAL